MSSVQARAEHLRQAIRLLTVSSEVVIKEWEEEERNPSLKQSDGSSVPSHNLYNARRAVLGAIGVCTDLVQDPRARLMEMSLEFYEARALHVVAEVRVADVLAKKDNGLGVHIDELGLDTGINANKLGRVLRTLCTTHIFQEVSYNRFANSTTSQVLVKNEALRAFILTMAWCVYTASTKIPDVLLDSVKTHSESALDTPFQASHNTQLHFFEWLEETEQQPDGSTKPKRDLEVFGLAMLGGGRAISMPLYRDYPWQDLGSATVVDVGGGVGGLCLDLLRLYPNLKFVIQDRALVVKQSETVWQRENPDALKTGRVQLMPHDFFTEQPVKEADVYHMRYIMHDWPDKECVKILKALRAALGPNSRILISDAVMLTTCPSSSTSFPGAPSPLLANYGAASRYNYLRDLNMLTCLNGRERSPEEWQNVATKAGLRVEKYWECRGVVWVTEMRKDGD